MDSNIPANPAYGVYISQLVRYARIYASKVDFINRLRGLSKPLLPRPPLCFRPLRLTWSVVKYIAIASLWRLYRGREWPLSTSNFVKLMWLVNFLCIKNIYSNNSQVSCEVYMNSEKRMGVYFWVRLPTSEFWALNSYFDFWVPTSELRPPNHVWLLSSLRHRRKKENGRGDRPGYKDQAFFRILSVKWDFQKI